MVEGRINSPAASERLADSVPDVLRNLDRAEFRSVCPRPATANTHYCSRAEYSVR